MFMLIVSRLGRSSSGSPDSMSSSYHGNTSSSINNDTNTLIDMSTSLIENVTDRSNNIMVQSLDPTILSSSPSSRLLSDSSNTRAAIAQMNDQQARQSNPLASASKMVPVPEFLMSPDCPPASNVPQKTVPINNKISSIKSIKGKSHLIFEEFLIMIIFGFLYFKESKLVSPKTVTRTSLPKKAPEKSHEKSPVLNVRKNNTINAALKANLHADQQAKLRNANHAGSPPPPPQIHSATPEHATDASSDDDSDHFNVDKLKKIRCKAAQK